MIGFCWILFSFYYTELLGLNRRSLRGHLHEDCARGVVDMSNLNPTGTSTSIHSAPNNCGQGWVPEYSSGHRSSSPTPLIFQ